MVNQKGLFLILILKKMAKDPAFLFYPNDWLGGTLGMTFEEKGAYIDLLMMQFNRGHMSGHMVGQVVGQLWVKIQDKFTQDEKGLWYNERLEIEQKKRQTFTASRKNNLKGENQYTKKEKNKGHINGHMTSHMENENRNENEDGILKGVQGEKLDFALNDTEIGKVIEFVKILAPSDITKFDVLERWRAFEIESESEFYLSRAKKVTHFRNWLKNRIKNGEFKSATTNGHGNNKKGTSEYRVEVISAYT